MKLFWRCLGNNSGYDLLKGVVTACDIDVVDTKGEEEEEGGEKGPVAAGLECKGGVHLVLSRGRSTIWCRVA